MGKTSERPRLAAGGVVFRLISRAGNITRSRFFPGRVRKPLYRGGVLEEFLYGQPVNVALRVTRAALSVRRATRPGTTVVIVNFNTSELLRDVIPAVRRFSPPNTQILVLDNDSKDGGWQWLRKRPAGIKAVRLPVNLGHGRALDLGMWLSRTETVVTLDSDAFPIGPHWLETVEKPLNEQGYLAAGSWGRRDRLHPAFSAHRRSAFLRTKLSFANYKPHLDTGEEPVFGINCFDTGERLFAEFGRERVFLVPVTTADNGWGELIGDVVYHHRAMTGYDISTEQSKEAVLAERRRTWNEAVAEHLSERTT